MSCRFYSLWAINGPLDLALLKGQLDDFRSFGLEGAVFHPRFYPNQPTYLSAEYLEIVSQTILHAREIGLGFWIYDENGWPSGTADGRLFTERPDDVAVRLDLFPGSVRDALVSFEHEGETWSLAVQPLRGLNCYSSRACSRFLEDIHERYRKGLTPEAFAHVEAFFTDEPESGASWEPMPRHGGIPWSPEMLQQLKKRVGGDIECKLPLLFFPGKGSDIFRIAYWELVTDLFVEGFFDPYRQWCERWGKKLVGHVKGEEHPLFQLPMVGSCQRAYRGLSFPGIDALERLPSNDFFPRQAASIAHQFGDGRVMAECFGGAGWGAGPEDLESYLLWLGRNGVTDFVLHLSQYRLNSAAIRDWPPSQPLHLTWKEAYPEMLKRVRNELEREAAARSSVDVLVIAPYRGIMASYQPQELLATNIHNAHSYPDTAAGGLNQRFLSDIEKIEAGKLRWEVTDERSFEEEAIIEAGKLRLGKRRYKEIIVGHGSLLSETGKKLEAHLKDAGLLAGIPKARTADLPLPNAEHPAWSPLSWTPQLSRPNHLLVELKPEGTGWFVGNFICADQDFFNIQLEFVDEIREMLLNNVRLEVISGEMSGLSHPVKPSENNEIRVRYEEEVRHPYLWLKGSFKAVSEKPFLKGPGRTVRAEGPFILKKEEVCDGIGDWTQKGYSFAKAPLVAEAHVTLSFPTPAWRFVGQQGDAVRLFVDNLDLGWAWGPDWEFQPAIPLLPGHYTFRIELIPSAYNFYGPHHYYRGDAPVVSPDQFEGKKNFADPADAPNRTHKPFWHFKPYVLPDVLLLFRARLKNLLYS